MYDSTLFRFTSYSTMRADSSGLSRHGAPRVTAIILYVCHPRQVSFFFLFLFFFSTIRRPASDSVLTCDSSNVSSRNFLSAFRVSSCVTETCSVDASRFPSISTVRPCQISAIVSTSAMFTWISTAATRLRDPIATYATIRRDAAARQCVCVS